MRVPGICDRCGQRYRLSLLREEYVVGRPTGNRVCPSCYDDSHPQLDTRHVKTNDKQRVDDPRSDIPELETSRAMYAWNPVGQVATTIDIAHGTVKVETE